MRNAEALRYKTRLDNLFAKISSLQGDLELQSQWARYLCVLVAGFLETSISAIYVQYAEGCAAPNVATFVATTLDRSANLNMERVLQLTRSFNVAWSEELQKMTEGEIKNAIDSICNNRNLIAHGKDTGITFHRIRDYYRQAIIVVQMVEDQCLGQ